ncbi:MAG: phosphoglycolate phosphatase [Gemmatales bacterium]|nr:MAG: phosphoglycolate phosphatase [Gemmatales bacterium]
MRVVFFDIDGTLILSGGAGRAAMEGALCRAFNVPLHHQRVSFTGRTDRAIAHDLLTLHNIEDTAENWQRFRDVYLHDLPSSLHQFEGVILPGVVEFINELNRLPRLAVGLLTGNIREGARIKLAHYGLAGHFAFGGFGDDHFHRDDVAREALAAANAFLGEEIRTEHVWVIGDTPLDVRCARAIGARVAAVATGWHSAAELARENPDLVFENLSQAEPLLDLLTK